MTEFNVDDAKYNRDLKKFSLFSKTVTRRREGLGIKISEAMRELAPYWNLSPTTAIVYDLESPYRLALKVQREVKKHGLNVTSVQLMTGYMSDYMSYLGFSLAESRRIFSGLEGISDSLKYIPSSVHPSHKAKVFKKTG